jgi:nucleotide-binding universal stress UspA family protein
VDKGKLVVVAVRDEASGRIAAQRARQLAAPRDRLAFVHVARAATLERLLAARPGLMRVPPSGQAAAQPAWLTQLAREAGADARCEVLDGVPGAAISEFAREHRADAIVLATQREGQIRELILGSTALRVLRTAPCPVVVTRGRDPRPYERALVAIDLDESGQRVALATGALLGDVQIDLVHAFRLPQEGQLRMRGLDEREIEQLRKFAREDLEPRLHAHRTAFPRAVVHVEYGFAASVILELVGKLRPDVLVLGKHRGSSTHERMLGSITQFLLYTCPTDVVLVP